MMTCQQSWDLSVEKYLADSYSLAAGTRKRRAEALGRYGRFCAGTGLDPGARESVRAWLADAALRGVMASTRAVDLLAVRGLGQWQARSGGPDPTRGISLPRVPSRLPPYLSVEDAAAVCEYYPRGDPGRALCEFLYGAGVRVGEAVGLRWGDLDLTGRWARVRGKGDRERLVPFGVPCAEAFQEWLTASMRQGKVETYPTVTPPPRAKRPPPPPGAGGLFAGPGRVAMETRVWPHTTWWAWDQVRRAGRGALDRDLHPHVLRHACATHLIQGGADLRTVQDILGHASPATTTVYLHLTGRDQRAAYDRAWAGRW